ncbi:MAG: transcription repressor NadR [Lachnospiraceae bacterium]|nr:transcription repressor NadR [Lachnospiraceae bacterium]
MENKTEGTKRRKMLLSILQKAERPVSGTALSGELGVSRQIIVQDVALLRASDIDILSTPRGYVLYQKEQSVYTRRFKVNHATEDLQNELQLIVDQGAIVTNVIIEHPIYGEIQGRLGLCSRRDVNTFLQKVKEQKGIPLLEISGGLHYHTVQADQEEILDEVENQLRQAGYLID